MKLLRNMNLIEKNSEFGYAKFYEAARIFFVRKENNNNIIYSAILFPELPSSAILESTPEHNQCNERRLRSACARCLLNVNNADNDMRVSE